MRSFSISTMICLFGVIVSGCATFKDLEPGTVKKISASTTSIVDRQVITVTPEPSASSQPAIYTIGTYDVLAINVSGISSNVSNSVPGVENATSAAGDKAIKGGSVVDAAGIVYLPQVGGIKVVGLTIPDAQEKVRTAYLRYYKHPWVVIQVTEYRSRPLYLLGQFKKPGVYYMDRPMTILEGVALGGGFDEKADIAGARITRSRQFVPVDLEAVLTRGQLDAGAQQVLQPGDAIYIPDNRNQQVFVFGSVKKPGPVPMPPAGMNLSQAIASAELADVGYDFRYVRIIRSLSATEGELLVVDFGKTLRGEALPIMLKSGDVVYVPRSNIGDWNTAIAEMLPTLQAVSALLQPFVNIKYLSGQ
ncbi:MAG: sugar transporter [Geobacteraceae bacterium]|nr:sugar transporter [Geobacteraceae bacterium]NTW79515.1 sugar transporter [Geobacteraceae bacterium]